MSLAQSTERAGGGAAGAAGGSAKGGTGDAKGGSTIGALDEALLSAKRALKSGDLFTAIADASKALREARAKRAYEAMAAILPVLRDARCAVRNRAVAAGTIYRIDRWGESDTPEPGMWLVEPPAVGADGRALRDRACAAGIPVFVMVREPETRDGRWPMVMVGPATTRAKVAPPPEETPSPEWLLASLEALARSALDTVDGSAPETRLNQLFDRLETIPEAEAIYNELAKACVEAAAARADAEARKRAPKGE